MKKLLFTLGFALMAVVLQAQTWEDRSCGLHIYYKLDKADIDMEYRNNRSSIDSLANMLKRMMVESPHRNLVLNVTSYASLEASYAYNEKLTARRTEALLACLKEKVAGLPDTVQIQNNVFDWNTLKVRVNDVENMPYRAEVMEVLLADREGSQAEQESRRKADLQRLGGGEAYRFINRRLGAEMRQSCMDLSYQVLDFGSLAPVVDLPVPAMPQVSAIKKVVPSLPAKARRPFYMAVKTNLLYDALLIPNVGLEFYLGKQWSLAGNWMYAWWKNDRKHNYWRTYGGDLEVRRWFGKKAEAKPLTGHHVGVYAGVVTYDFELGGRGYLGDKWSYHAGVSYGYSHPIARRLNLDFTVGFGYLGGKYMEYIPDSRCYVWEYTKQRNWIGPTKAEISLVWLWGHGNVNTKKGGRK